MSTSVTCDYRIVDGKLTWVRPGVTTLDLSDNQLTTLLPGAIPAGVTTLDLSDNQLTTLLPGAIPAGVTWLDLWGNQLTELLPGVIPAGVTTLDLSGNQLTDEQIAEAREMVKRNREAKK